MVNFTLPFKTNEMTSFSISQTFRSWVVIFHLCRPMAFISLSLYDMSGLAPPIDVLFWWQDDISSNTNTVWNAWNCHSGRFIVDTGILFSNIKSPSHECWIIFRTLICYSDFPNDQTFYQFHDLVTFIKLRVVSMEHLQRVWYASREFYSSWHLVPHPF